MGNTAAGQSGQASVGIMLNGMPHKVPTGQTIAGLIEALGLPLTRLGVERNLEIVPRSAYLQVRLEPGDRVEIVNFVGGG